MCTHALLKDTVSVVSSSLAVWQCEKGAEDVGDMGREQGQCLGE